MSDFSEIEAIAVRRKGSAAAVEAQIITPLSTKDLAYRPLSIWLEAMAKTIFQAGFNWRVIETKWPGFQAAFEGFDPERINRWGDGELDRLVSEERVVRNGAKIDAVMVNARFLTQLQVQPAMQRLIWRVGRSRITKGCSNFFPREAKGSAETPDNGFAGWWAATVMF